MGFFFFFFEGG